MSEQAIEIIRALDDGLAVITKIKEGLDSAKANIRLMSADETQYMLLSDGELGSDGTAPQRRLEKIAHEFEKYGPEGTTMDPDDLIDKHINNEASSFQIKKELVRSKMMEHDLLVIELTTRILKAYALLEDYSLDIYEDEDDDSE